MNLKEIKERIKISSYLFLHGHKPFKETNGQLAYLSPFRKETVPSFFVNDTKGVWYDHGEGQGGTIIDLAMRLQGLDISGIIRYFNRQDGSKHLAPYTLKQNRTSDIENGRQPVILKIQEIGNNPALVDYLKSRRIYDQALEFPIIKEVYYKVFKNNHYRHYFGVGWQNKALDWEISSKYGKVCFFKKDVVKSLKNEAYSKKEVSVFESMFDFLSAIKLKWISQQENVIILNSTALLNKAISILEANDYSVNLFLDNDPAGDKATRLLSKTTSAKDCREKYKGYKDVNDFLIGESHSF